MIPVFGWRAAATLLAVAALLVGCTTVPVALVMVHGWRALPMPSFGARILAVEPDGDGLLVLGSVPGRNGRAPSAWTTADGMSWRPVPVQPHTVYAGPAELVAAGSAPGGHVMALGPSGDTMLVSQAALAGGQAYLALRVDNRARLMSTGPDCAGWRDVPLPVGADEVRVGQLSDGLLLATTDATSSELWLRGR